MGDGRLTFSVFETGSTFLNRIITARAARYKRRPRGRSRPLFLVRRKVVTARGLTRRPLSNGSAAVMLAKIMSTWPLATGVTPSDMPL